MMNFENFRTNYNINSQRAIEMAQIFGVSMAQVQLWIIRIVKGN